MVSTLEKPEGLQVLPGELTCSTARVKWLSGASGEWVEKKMEANVQGLGWWENGSSLKLFRKFWKFYIGTLHDWKLVLCWGFRFWA